MLWRSGTKHTQQSVATLHTYGTLQPIFNLSVCPLKWTPQCDHELYSYRLPCSSNIRTLPFANNNIRNWQCMRLKSIVAIIITIIIQNKEIRQTVAIAVQIYVRLLNRQEEEDERTSSICLRTYEMYEESCRLIDRSVRQSSHSTRELNEKVLVKMSTLLSPTRNTQAHTYSHTQGKP